MYCSLFRRDSRKAVRGRGPHEGGYNLRLVPTDSTYRKQESKPPCKKRNSLPRCGATNTRVVRTRPPSCSSPSVFHAYPPPARALLSALPPRPRGVFSPPGHCSSRNCCLFSKEDGRCGFSRRLHGVGAPLSPRPGVLLGDRVGSKHR